MLNLEQADSRTVSDQEILQKVFALLCIICLLLPYKNRRITNARANSTKGLANSLHRQTYKNLPRKILHLLLFRPIEDKKE